MSSSFFKAHLQMFCFTILLGGSFVASGYISNSLPPLITTWLRYLIASFVFIGLMQYQKALKIPNHTDLIRYTLIALPPLFYFICMLFAMQKTNAIDSSALYTSVPLMSMILSVIILKSKINVLVLITLLLGILGALLIIFKGDISKVLLLSFTPSNQLFLLGCLGMAINPIVIKILYRGEQSIYLTGWSLIMATIMLTLVVCTRLSNIAWSNISSATWMSIFYLAIFTTALSFFLFQKACLVLSPTQISGYVYLIPLSVICTNAILGNPQAWQAISGGIVLVLITMIILVKYKA